MRTFDLAPLYRSTVGFDRLFSMPDNVAGFDGGTPGYPPYNIERTGENAYRISVAVAGFSESELSIEAKENTLTIRGDKQTKTEEKKSEVLYQGIAARAFERVFQLAEHVEVKGASLENGLLHVDLVREVPEAKKPRQIAIGNGQRIGLKAERSGSPGRSFLIWPDRPTRAVPRARIAWRASRFQAWRRPGRESTCLE